MKYFWVFALFLVTVYSFPRGKSPPIHGFFLRPGSFPRSGNKVPHWKYPAWIFTICKTRKTTTKTPNVSVTAVQPSQETPAIPVTTAGDTPLMTSSFTDTVQDLSTPDNDDFARGDN